MGDISIIIMTESSKFSGKCVAGISTETGEWVRLVSDDEEVHGAISNDDLICSNGRKCNVLDRVSVPIICACGNQIQPENILIDGTKRITFQGKSTFLEVLDTHPAEERDYILGNKYSYITEQRVNTVGYSLALVKVNNLEIMQVETPEGKPKTKAKFQYQDEEYSMVSVTDPRFYSVPNGTEYDEAFLVVSIGTSYNGKYYKFVSGIFV